MLTDAQVERYGRQIILPEVGGRGQERLLAARVAVAGAGPAATAAVTLLGRAGVGTLHVSAGVGPLPELSPDCRCGSSEGPAADVAVGLLELTATDDDVPHGAPFGLEAARRPFVLGLELTTTDDDAPAHDTPFGLEAARRSFVLGLLVGDRILVATLVGRPCMRCWGQALAPGELGGDRAAGGAAHATPARLALGALTASEVLRVLLSPPVHGRLTTLGLEGSATARDLAAAGCSCCAGSP